MRTLMGNLAGLIARRRWLIVGAWLAIVAFSLPLAARQTEDLSGGGFDVPGSQSEAVEKAVTHDFASSDRGRLALVLQPEPGLTVEAASSAVDRAGAQVAKADGATIAPKVAARAKADLAAGGVAVVPVDAKGDSDELVDTATELRDELSPGEAAGGVTPYLVGQPAMWAALAEVSREDLASAERTGFPIVALILIAVFGSLAAATLPLALGFVAVTITGAVIYLLSQQMEMSVFVTNMASMIGIGVAVDYSLFILARFRESVRSGRSSAEARAEALSTSGLAVTFSGLAVIISLAGLWMVENQALRSMALGAMVVVAIAILVATTLLPALIRILGYRVEAGGVAWSVIGSVKGLWRRRRRPGSTAPGRESFWQRWTDAVMRRPVLSVLGASAILLTLSIPVLSLTTGNGALKQFSPDNDARVGYRAGGRGDRGRLRPGAGPGQLRQRDPRRPLERGCRPRLRPASPRRSRGTERGAGGPHRRPGARRPGARRGGRIGADARPRPAAARPGRPRLGTGGDGGGRRRRRVGTDRRFPRSDQRLDVEDHRLRPRLLLCRPDGHAALAAVCR